MEWGLGSVGGRGDEGARLQVEGQAAGGGVGGGRAEPRGVVEGLGAVEGGGRRGRGRVRRRAQVHAHALQADGALGQRVGAGGAAAQGRCVEEEGLV